MLGADWWSVSSVAVGRYGRGSGGCTIFDQHEPVARASFKKTCRRICGTSISRGFSLDVFFLH